MVAMLTSTRRTPDIGDQALNNQYTQTPRPAGGQWDYTYDANGNLLIKAQHSVADYNGDYTHNFFDMSQFMIDYGNGDPDADYNGDGQLNYADVSAFSAAYGPLDGTSLEHWHYGYDFRNQLVEISHRQGTSTLAETFNIYDALARRVKESIDLNADSTPDAAKQLVYGGVSSWEVLEQIDLLNDETMFTHVFGIGIDDEVSYRIEDVQTPEDYWAHRDDLGEGAPVGRCRSDRWTASAPAPRPHDQGKAVRCARAPSGACRTPGRDEGRSKRASSGPRAGLHRDPRPPDLPAGSCCGRH